MLLILGPAAQADPVRAGSDYTLAASTRGTALDLRLTSTADHPIRIALHVAGGSELQFDWLTVELDDAHGTRRVLRFVGDRDRSATIYTTLAPGAATTESVDLQAWAIRQGAPLAPGTYRVRARWDALAATTTLVVAAPVRKLCTAPATDGLALLAAQSGSGAQLLVGLHNTGATPLCVAAAIDTHEIQSDWMTVTIGPRVLRFDDNRNESARRLVELPPGATTWETWDLDAWARRSRNGAKALAKGEVWATVVYAVPDGTDVWHGRTATSVRVGVP